MNWLTSFISKVSAVFHEPAVTSALDTVARIVLVAQPIVAEIAALTPNRTFAQINAAYQKFGVPLSQLTTAALITAVDPQSAGNALLNLGIAAVALKLDKPVATNLISSGVSLAVTAMKAGA